jgi:hypothetical protein
VQIELTTGLRLAQARHALVAAIRAVLLTL